MVYCEWWRLQLITGALVAEVEYDEGCGTVGEEP
jgi:hypothetical protein